MPAGPDDWRRTGQDKTMVGLTFTRRAFAAPAQDGLRAWRSKSAGVVIQSFDATLPSFADDWEEIEPQHSWDHEHCAFCWAKLMAAEASPRDPEAVAAGYVTEDGVWVCDPCFAAFRDEFEWTVSNGAGPEQSQAFRRRR